MPQLYPDEVDYIFRQMFSQGYTFEVEESSAATESHEPTLNEIYYALIQQGCTVEEIEVTHELKMDETGTVRELRADDIQEIEEAIYEI